MRKRGTNSWQLLVHIGVDDTGRRRYASKTIRGTKRQAEIALAAFVTESAKGELVATGPISVESVVSAWLTAKAPRLAASTVARYEVAIKQIVPAIGSMSVARFRSRDIEDFYAGLYAAGQSGSSIRKVHWAMRQALAWAKRRGYVSMLATEGIELPPLGEKVLEPPDSAHVRAVIEAGLCEDRAFGTMIAFVAWTGCRRGEVCAIKWCDLDLAGGSAIIRRSIVATPGGVIEKGTKTGEARRLALGPATVALLNEQKARCEPNAESCGTAIGATSFVFSPNVNGAEPWNPCSLSRHFRNALKASGAPHMRLHDLRHHSATTLLKNRVSVGEVMNRHSWKTLEMVGRYRHLLDATDRVAAAMLEQA